MLTAANHFGHRESDGIVGNGFRLSHPEVLGFRMLRPSVVVPPGLPPGAATTSQGDHSAAGPGG